MIIYQATFSNGKKFYGVASSLAKRKADHEKLARRGSPLVFHVTLARHKYDEVTYEEVQVNLQGKFVIEQNGTFNGDTFENIEKIFLDYVKPYFSVQPDRKKDNKTKRKIASGVRARKASWKPLYKQEVSDKISATKSERYHQGAYPHFTPQKGSYYSVLKVRGSRWFNDGYRTYRLSLNDGLGRGLRLGRLKKFDR